MLREAEWTEHQPVAPGYEGTLSAIVAKVRGFEDLYGWLSVPPTETATDPLAAASPPLTTAEMLQLKISVRSWHAAAIGASRPAPTSSRHPPGGRGIHRRCCCC